MYIGISDHKIVSLHINLEAFKENVSEELIFIYHKGNFEKLRKSLADNDWRVVDDKVDINES